MRIRNRIGTGLGRRSDVAAVPRTPGGRPRFRRAGEDGARACDPHCGASSAVGGKDRGMTDNVPVRRKDGPAEHGAAQGADAVSGAPAQMPDPAALGTAFPRTHHVLMLEFGNRKDFDDPRKEWRRVFSELLGTFALVLAAAGGGLLHAEGKISLAAAVVAPGLMVMAIILFMGAVSGAHLNPAVSLAFALRGDFPWRRVPGYIVTQLVGATLACLFLRWVFGNVEHLGATLPGPGYQDWQALAMEIVLTALLVSVILGTASAAQTLARSPRL